MNGSLCHVWGPVAYQVPALSLAVMSFMSNESEPEREWSYLITLPYMSNYKPFPQSFFARCLMFFLYNLDPFMILMKISALAFISSFTILFHKAVTIKQSCLSPDFKEVFRAKSFFISLRNWSLWLWTFYSDLWKAGKRSLKFQGTKNAPKQFILHRIHWSLFIL